MSSYQPVKYQSHLALDDVDLPPSSEWEAPRTCWCFVRVAEGQGYWLDVGEAREVNTGDVLVLPPSCSGLFRSSQLSAVRLAYFRFCPELMSGLPTMAERHYFDKLAGKEGRAPRLLPASHQVAKQFSELCGESRARNVLLVRCEMLQIVGHALAREIAPASRSETATLSATKQHPCAAGESDRGGVPERIGGRTRCVLRLQSSALQPAVPATLRSFIAVTPDRDALAQGPPTHRGDGFARDDSGGHLWLPASGCVQRFLQKAFWHDANRMAPRRA